MEDKAAQISERLLDYGLAIIKICARLNKTAIGKHIGNQLLRSGTSVGANYEEARGAQSRADFIHKLHIVLKETRESMYWLKLIQRSQILRGAEFEEALKETERISKIIGKSVITAKKRQ